MKEEIVSFKTAKLAKEKGFDECSDTLYRELTNGGHQTINPFNGYDFDINAPTKSLLQKWLREKHNIHVWLIPAEIDKTYRAYIGYGIRLDLIESLFTKSFSTYEQALEAGLYEALKLIEK